MADNEAKQNQKYRSDGTKYFWDYRGYDFKRSKRGIYEPVGYRPGHDAAYRSTQGSVPISITKSWFDLALAVSGWLISLATLTVVGLYTFYAGGQWLEMRKATRANTEASQTAACALEESKQQFRDTLGQMQSQTTAQQTAATASQHAAASTSQQLEAFKNLERALLKVVVVVDRTKRETFFIVENVGLSAAIHINARPEMPSEIADQGYGYPGEQKIRELTSAGTPDPNGFILPAGQVRCFTWGLGTEADIGRYAVARKHAFLGLINVAYDDVFGRSWGDAHGCFFRHTGSVRYQSCFGSRERVDLDTTEEKKCPQ